MRQDEARKILGIDADATEEQITKAYRKLAMKHHPDRGGETAEFTKVKDAYETLTKKKNNEESLFGFRRNSTEEELDAFNAWREMFEAYRGSDHASTHRTVNVSVSFKDALEGITRFVILNNAPAYTTPEEKKYEIRIPPGAANGAILKVEDNTIFRLNIYAPDCEWSTYGIITKDIKVSALTMIVGGWVEVSLPDESVIKVRIPAGMQNGMKLKVAQKGYAIFQGKSARGDLFLRVTPEIKQLNACTVDELETLSAAIKNILADNPSENE